METKKNPEMEIGRNSGLYFALGLCIMLFISWQLLEYRTYDTSKTSIDVINMDQEIEDDIPIVNVNAPPPPPPPVAIQESIQIVEDAIEVEETVIKSTETDQSDKIADVVVSVADVAVEDVEEDVVVPFAVIEDIPVFPGCENAPKNQRRDCFQEKMEEHVRKNFTYPEAALDLGIQGKVFVMFVIDSNGYVTGIKSRGPAKILENEAERIIGLLPKMSPGKQRGKAVKVPYSVPIVFKFLAS